MDDNDTQSSRQAIHQDRYERMFGVSVVLVAKTPNISIIDLELVTGESNICGSREACGWSPLLGDRLAASVLPGKIVNAKWLS